MGKCFGDCFSHNNYLSVIILLTLGVLFYMFILQKEVQEEFEIKIYRSEFLEDVWPVWLKTPPDKVVQFLLDLNGYLHKTDKRFLSFSIVSSEIYRGFRNPSLSDIKLRHIVSHLRGGYLRVGGRAADSLFFSPAFRAWPDKQLPLDGGYCSFKEEMCPTKPRLPPKFSMNADDWNELNEFALTTGSKLLFDFNLLLRDRALWNSSNAELLLDFSFAYQYHIDWQLGNEPNAYKKSFGIEVTPDVLAKDFNSLKTLLQQYKLYNSSLLIGPDVAHPKHGRDISESTLIYLSDFLKSHPNIDAVSWHHYNTGPDASLDDYLDVATYDNFIENCNAVNEAVRKSMNPPKPVWLSESGSSFGGGAQNLSDRFVGSLLWADKLGSGAKAGISVIVRQSLYRGVYALIDPSTLTPNPDFWVSVLHKNIIKETVLNLTVLNRSGSPTLRVYAHCSKSNHVAVFGVNIANVSQGLYLPMNQTGLLYCLHSADLQSRTVQLNGNVLHLKSDGSLPLFKPLMVDLKNVIPIPPYSIFFLQIYLHHPACISSQHTILQRGPGK